MDPVMIQDPSFWLSNWDWDPKTLLGGVLVLGIYLTLVGPYRARHFPTEPVKLNTKIYFTLAILVVILAQISPLDELSDNYLFSAHMFQHILFTVVAPPLLLLGVPDWFFRPILSRPNWMRAARFLTNPILAFFLFNIIYAGWHFPAAYEATLENETLHLFEHITFVVSALLFWWPILSPVPELPRLPYPTQVLYLFLASVPCTVLGALIIFTPKILYATYANAPRISSLSPMNDQQIAGVLMAMGVNMVYLFVLSVVFFKWLNHEESRKISPAHN
jgi:putative membrane protein